MRERLLIREWTIIALVTGLVIALATIAWISQRNGQDKMTTIIEKRNREPKLEITVEGAVENPGTYFLNPGVTLREILKMTGFKKEANRRQLDLNRVFYCSQAIYIPFKAQKKRASSTKKSKRNSKT
jgi:hypothetical protein